MRTVRIAVLVSLVALTAPVAVDYATRTAAAPDGADPDAATTTPSPSPAGAESPTERRSEAPADRTGPTGTVAYVVDAQGPGQLTVFDRATGEVVYRTERMGLYHDVDPSPAGEQTLQYVASNVTGGPNCPPELPEPCTVNAIERLNYSTGEVERLYSRTLEYNGSSNTHDVDRIGPSRYLVGDIQFDRVFVANVTTGETGWIWNASAEFDRSTGGRPGDWTHLNDVEVLGEGLYMVNLRNQDQVVFVERGRGMMANRTLGAEDDHATLYEQHNPDYIPAERGGPAILVADSENNRVIEYQRRGGSWVQSWVWADEQLRWPRDADRLPNNNTMIVDTHGTRLVEVTPAGEIVWQRTVPRGVYDAELLGTGDESTGGRSMAAIRGEPNATRTTALEGVENTAQRAFLEAFPSLVLNGFLYVLPSWVSPLSGALLLVAGLVSGLWGVGEGLRAVASLVDRVRA